MIHGSESTDINTGVTWCAVNSGTVSAPALTHGSLVLATSVRDGGVGTGPAGAQARAPVSVSPACSTGLRSG